MNNNTLINKICWLFWENLKLAKLIPNRQVLIHEIKAAKRILLWLQEGAACIKMAAMRFMHLGYTVFIVGETNTPAILEGDLLLVASGSGTTSSVVSSAES
jgi:6-phospho-3-hexuloisomerase